MTSDQNSGPQGDNKTTDPEKLLKIEEERKELLNKVLSGSVSNPREKVAYILNNYSEARNSDLELAWIFWKTFEQDIFDGYSLTKAQFHQLTRIGSLTRIRARIQNEYKLFQADDIVKKYRGVLEEEKKTEAIEAKPSNLPLYTVYIDETGKTQTYLSIGSLWIIDGGFSTYQTSQKLSEWKKNRNIDFEFHFAQLSQHRLEDYKDFFMEFLALNPAIGFKIIVINNQGFQNKGQTITDLTFHLINKGIDHENRSGRAPLPRRLQVYLDEDEKGSDKLKLENLKERITSQKINGLILGHFDTVNSKGNYYVQAVDLFTASVNRKLHNKDTGHVKDILANFILKVLKFDVQDVDKLNTKVDKSAVFNLL